MESGGHTGKNVIDLEIKGWVAEREIREALAWIGVNRDLLFDEWRRNNP